MEGFINAVLATGRIRDGRHQHGRIRESMLQIGDQRNRAAEAGHRRIASPGFAQRRRSRIENRTGRGNTARLALLARSDPYLGAPGNVSGQVSGQRGQGTTGVLAGNARSRDAPGPTRTVAGWAAAEAVSFTLAASCTTRFRCCVRSFGS